MKVLHADINDNHDVSADTLRNLERLVCAYAYAVPDGWRAIIEMQCAQEQEPYFQLDVQGNQGGGDYAEAKMAMLKRYPDLSATGLETPKAFIECIRPALREIYTNLGNSAAAEDVLDAISVLDNIEQMPEVVAELLRNHGLTSYKGAIRIPYEILVSDKRGVNPDSGEIRIAFSGATEWQDLYFATDIFAALQHSLNKLWSNGQIRFNLRGLEANPQTKMWLHLLNVREA